MPNFRVYRATIQFNDRLVGGIPVVPEGENRHDMYEKWARGQGVEDTGENGRTLPEMLAEDPDMPVTVDEIEGLETGFRRDEDGIYIEARQVKAMIRESAQRLGLIKQVRGMRQVVQHDLHVRATDGSQKLRLGDSPDGTDSRPIAVVTRQGPRTSIKRFQYVNQPTLTFDLWVLAGGVADGICDEQKLRDVLEFGGWLGLGADRSQGEGTFTLTQLVELN